MRILTYNLYMRIPFINHAHNDRKNYRLQKFIEEVLMANSPQFGSSEGKQHLRLSLWSGTFNDDEIRLAEPLREAVDVIMLQECFSLLSLRRVLLLWWAYMAGFIYQYTGTPAKLLKRDLSEGTYRYVPECGVTVHQSPEEVPTYHWPYTFAC